MKKSVLFDGIFIAFVDKISNISLKVMKSTLLYNLYFSTDLIAFHSLLRVYDTYP